MKRPRVRFTVRRMMIAVAVLALLLVGVRTIASRPHPSILFSSAAHYVAWSDGTMTAVSTGPREPVFRYYRLATLVSWPDGSFSVYLHPWRRDVWAREGGPESPSSRTETGISIPGHP